MARHNVRVYAAVPSVDFVAVADTDRNAGRRIASKYKCKYYQNHLQLLDSEALRAIMIYRLEVIPEGEGDDYRATRKLVVLN